MKLQNARLAVVERQKVVEYLLNAAHPDNGGKAKFFQSLGFSVADPERLASALLLVARDGDVIESIQSSHGQKYVVDGWIPSQIDSTRGMVRTIWIIHRYSGV